MPGRKQTIFINCINFEKYFVFLSLGDALASADKKKGEIDSKESILILLCFRPDTTYIVVSFVLSTITIDRKVNNGNFNRSIFLSTNGIHLDIVIPRKDVDSLLLSGIKYCKTEKYLSFGWGDEKFYMNTPTWGDLTFSNAFEAIFLRSTTLMHVTRYKHKRSNWIEIKVNNSELEKLNSYLFDTFELNQAGLKIILKNKGYTSTDDFYRSKGSYSCFKTCNSWVNTGFKESGLKSCLWTPFDFGLLNKYE